jgi:hypothetical protein
MMRKSVFKVQKVWSNQNTAYVLLVEFVDVILPNGKVILSRKKYDELFVLKLGKEVTFNLINNTINIGGDFSVSLGDLIELNWGNLDFISEFTDEQKTRFLTYSPKENILTIDCLARS